MTDELAPPPGPEPDDDPPIEAPAEEIASGEARPAEDAEAADQAPPAESGDAPGQAGSDDDESHGGSAGPAPSAAAERGPSRRATVAVALVALLAGAGAALALGKRGSDCPGKDNALEVEGTAVSAAEYGRRIELLRALYDVRPPAEEAKLAAFRGDAAKGMAVAVLVTNDVADRNLGVAEKTVRDGLDRFIAQRYPEGGRNQFIEALGNSGVSEGDVLAEFRRLLETRGLFAAVTEGVTVSEEDVSRTFDEQKDQLAVPEQRRLRHLVVKTEDEAKAALRRIGAGETFESVAQATSLDATTKGQGGDLGTVAKAQLDAAFGAAAFAAAEEGGTFGPVQTKNGWHAGLVEDVTPGRPVTLAEVHDPLRDKLVGEARLAKWRSYLAGRLNDADACYAKGNRPADPKAAPPDLTTPSTLNGSPETTSTSR